MKKVLMFAFVLLASVAKAQEGSKYEAGMNKALAQYKVAETTDDMAAVSALFERIGDAEKDKWLPYYYAAQSNLMIGWKDEKSDRDKISEKSLALVEKAEALESNNAELFCMRQMIASQQMMVDPSSRWKTYGRLATTALENAKKADPNNPRIYLLEGQSTFYTPAAFGGGKKRALPMFEKSVTLFDTYVSPSLLHPSWGKDDALKMIEDCKK